MGRRFFLLLCALLLATLAWAARAEAPPLKKATFIPLWQPQAQFAGYYVALEKGIYRRHGIDLAILPGGHRHSPLAYLREGKADFAALWLATALQARDQGVPLVNVAQVVQDSSMLLVARKSSGIATIADLAGRRVGFWGGDFAVAAQAFLDANGLRVRKVPQGATVNLFLRGGVDVVSAMRYNEYHLLLNSGLDADELVVFPVRNYGPNVPEDGLYALERTVRADPALTAAFVAASLEGWQYAFAHPDEAIDIVVRRMTEANIPVNRPHQRWMLAHMREVIQPEGRPSAFGRLDEDDYRVLGRELQRMKIIRRFPAYGEFVRSGDGLR